MTTFEKSLKKIDQCLFWLNPNAKHAIQLKETFTYPAYNYELRNSIKGTNAVRVYKICLESIYFEFIMTLMRMYDNYERETACFKNLFSELSQDFIKSYEKDKNTKIKNELNSIVHEYNSLNGSHLVSRLTTVRNKLFAHTATNFNSNQFADYGHAEELLEKTLSLLNRLNKIFSNRIEPFEKIANHWKGFSSEFWEKFVSKTRKNT
jgi:hypothetical protein